jgi:hypothetical protein
MSLKELDSKMNRSKDCKKPVLVEEILSRMRMGKNTVSEIRMGDQMIPVRVLSADEVNSLRSKAKMHIAKKGGDETDENLYLQMITLQTAAKIGDDPVGFLNDKIMTALSVDEITYLYNELIHFWETLNPSMEQIAPERFRELVDSLKKNNLGWNDCSLPERKAIFTCFVELTQRPETATSQQVN